MSIAQLSVSEIRKTFLDFFEARGHTVVESSALVPGNDPTLMFTNSGMVQFKDVFLGSDRRPYVRATSVQACLRAGGKHNDLENVGYTARHHTFFEMLGNWSFGDYFKSNSLKWAWELLTHVYALPKERLWVTVYFEDDEAYDIWTKEIGLPSERVIRIGDNKGARYQSDNFWMMADTGPCGPCSEIFYDHGPEVAGGPPGSPDEDGDRFIEIWNNVFMQFDMQTDGSVKKLPAPCVDTGMGLERLAAIMQHVHSNYEIDLFVELIKAAARETGCSDLSSNSLKVIADHIRATSFLVNDGVVPSNEGRGYVQRRIIRRAIRHGYKLGMKAPFFHKLVPDLVRVMGDAYPNLRKNEAKIIHTLKLEEERFFETLDIGMEILESALGNNVTILHGDIAFKLHDTYGFPLDLCADVCREKGIEIDETGFHQAMDRQKSQARMAGKFKMDKALDYQGPSTSFVGYNELKVNAKVMALFVNAQAVDHILENQEASVVLDVTPFYAESGGQVGDQGVLSSATVQFQVSDCQKIKSDVFAHFGVLNKGQLKVGDSIEACVQKEARLATARHHSATHLMHLALRTVLGEHVQQKGSLVSPERTRFDFAHNAPLTDLQIKAIEDQVNRAILTNGDTQSREMDLESAKKTGAMMLFGEKYSERVRVLSIGESQELCGGTHVSATGDIGLFKVLSESGVAAGVRRIEAVCGEMALEYIANLQIGLREVAGLLKTSPDDLTAKVKQTLEHQKFLEKEISHLKNQLAASQSDDLLDSAVEHNGIKILVKEIQGLDAKALKDTVDLLKDKLKTCIVLLANVQDGKVQLVCGVSKDLISKVKAGDLVNHVAQQVGGKGGGKPDMAMAGGTQPGELKKALDSFGPWIKSIV
ncbi:MAG: alanine--tRNA ligase [Betaproteobacteria bacterium]